jgi:ABC-type multidrug transport system fused ATPase/permease subunit
LNSISNSPIYAHFSETLDGLATIRAYNLQNSMKEENATKVGTNLVVDYVNDQSNRWLGVNSGLIGSLIVLLAVIVATFTKVFSQRLSLLALLGVAYADDITSTLNVNFSFLFLFFFFFDKILSNLFI